MKTIITIAAPLLLAGAAALNATPALAQGSARAAIVQTADLDLSSSQGRAALERRLVQAARQVCGTPSPADLRGPALAEACRADVLAQAIARRESLYAAAAAGRPLRLIAAVR